MPLARCSDATLTHTLRRADEMEKTMIGDVRKETESGSRHTPKTALSAAPTPTQFAKN